MLEKFEKRHESLLPRSRFFLRLLKFALLSIGLIALSLVIGMLGYQLSEGMSWVDAFLNAAMLMGGMGQVTVLHTDAGKVFAGVYALYCGFILIVSVAVFLAPIYHRFLHHFHLEGEGARK
ncbi:MAG TPA: hypothetical protein DSN98_03260 [Thermoplasmata archaeon]|jgi:hypothetical protein|nr:MAG TPA: hypothetical protein DSN98_03260 [Thermoplasmata archaeon]